MIFLLRPWLAFLTSFIITARRITADWSVSSIPLSCLSPPGRRSARIGSVRYIRSLESRPHSSVLPFTVVTITCFRLMIVVKPLYSQVYCSSRNERKALILIFLFGILSIVPYYYYYLRPDALNVLRVISAMLSLLCPWVICVFLWISLIRIVNREIGLKKSKEFTLHSEIIAQRLKSKSKITKMVLVICFFNIICQLPVLILTIFGLLDSNPRGALRAYTYVVLLFLSNLLLIVNHAINFFIYSLTNCKFRYTLKVMCRRCCVVHDYLLTRTVTQRQTTVQDYQRQTPIQRPGTPKFDHNTCSNSKSRDSPHLIAARRMTSTTRLCVYNNTPPRVALWPRDSLPLFLLFLLIYEEVFVVLTVPSENKLSVVWCW